MPDTKGEIFEGYERQPQEVRQESSETQGLNDWTTQLEKRTAAELQKITENKNDYKVSNYFRY